MGEQLKEEKIAQELNISRSPIRGALNNLVAEKLLDEKANKGVFVHQATAKELSDLIEVRGMFEKKGIMEVEKKKGINKQYLEEIKRDFKKYHNIDVKKYNATDYKLHLELVSYSENNVCVEFYEQLYHLISMYRNIVFKNRVRYSDSLNEHIAIIDALLNKDYEKAWEEDHNHLMNTSIEIKEVLHKNSL